MYIEKVNLTNYGPHSSLSAEFGPGVTAILGKNGKGKSQLIDGLKFALSGKSSGLKEENITFGQSDGQAEAEFTSNGVKGRIRRGLRTSRCSMRLGDEKYSSAKDCEAAMQPILGDLDVLQNVVFAEQGEIASLLFCRDAQRSQRFQQLFGLRNAEAIRELCLNELNSTPAPPQAARLGLLEEDLKKLEPELAAKQAEVKAAKAGMLSPADHAVVLESIRKYESVQKDVEALAAAKTEHAGLVTKLMEVRAAHASAVATLSQMDADLAVVRPAAEQARRDLATLADVMAHNAAVVSLRQSLERQQASLQTPCPTITVDPAALAAGETEVARMKVELNISQKVLTAGRLATGGKCPTCDQPLSQQHVETHRAKAAELVCKLATETNKWDTARSRLRAEEYERRSWQTDQDLAKHEVTRLEQLIRVTGPEKPLSGADQRKELDELVALLAASENRRVAAAKAVDLRAQDVARLEGEQGALARRLMDLELAVAGTPMTAEQYEIAKNAAAAQQQKLLSVQLLEGSAFSLEQRRISLTNQLAEEKKAAPGSTVTVCLPALIRSASTWSSRGNGPRPRMPFSDCSTTSMPGGMALATRVGMPIPRLT